MGNKSEFYRIDGYYNQLGERGEQTGIVELYSDVRLIGKIQDTSRIWKSPSKLCLGVHRPGEIYLLKISVEDLRFTPIAWVLQKLDANKEKLEGKYRGNWLPVDGLEGIMLHANATVTFACDPEELRDFDIDKLGEYFATMRTGIITQGETGELSFSKIKEPKQG